MRTSLNVNNNVKENIKKYLEEKLSNYELISVGHVPTESDFIYRVLAKKKKNPYPEYMGDFAVWTCWNETTQSLNWGHYDLREEKATDLFMNYGSISEDRLIEIASNSIDGLIQDDYDEAMTYFKHTMELTPYEREFFGVDDEREDD